MNKVFDVLFLKSKEGVKMVEKLQKIDKILNNIIKVICILLLAGIIITVTISVTTRFIFFAPLNFADPLAAYLMAWLSFLGIGLGITQNEHISVDILLNRFTLKIKRKIILYTSIIISLFLLALINYGIIFGLSGLDTHDNLVFGLNMSIPYFSVSIGALYALIALNIKNLIIIFGGD